MIVHDFSSGMTAMSLACWCSGFVLPLKNIHSRNGTNMGSLIERNTKMLVGRQKKPSYKLEPLSIGNSLKTEVELSNNG